jgi:hypothetical protein
MALRRRGWSRERPRLRRAHALPARAARVPLRRQRPLQGRAVAGGGQRVFGGPTPRERRASQPRRRQHCWAQNATSIHDWWASRVETARISLKHMRRFRLAPRARGQNGARPGFRAIQHGECALGALEGRFCLPGRCVRIGGRAPTQGVHPSAMEVLGARNGQLPLRSRCLPPPSQNPMCGNRSVPARASSILAALCWVDTTPHE